MTTLDEAEICCPYCGESITVLVDASIGDQQYVEDCQVCCNPILLDVVIDDMLAPQVSPRQENG